MLKLLMMVNIIVFLLWENVLQVSEFVAVLMMKSIESRVIRLVFLFSVFCIRVGISVISLFVVRQNQVMFISGWNIVGCLVVIQIVLNVLNRKFQWIISFGLFVGEGGVGRMFNQFIIVNMIRMFVIRMWLFFMVGSNCLLVWLINNSRKKMVLKIVLLDISFLGLRQCGIEVMWDGEQKVDWVFMRNRVSIRIGLELSRKLMVVMIINMILVNLVCCMIIV